MMAVWTVAPPANGAQYFSPNPSPTFNQLFGVEAISPTDVWAVGDFDRETDNRYTRTLTLHWDGTAWTRVRTPDPSWDQSLYGVSASSSTDVWAVGTFRRSELGAPLRTFAIHWDGTGWSKVRTPNPSARSGYLEEVEAISPTDAWAVGTYEDSSTGRAKTLTLHWDGARWSRVWSPSPGWRGNLLKGVDSTPATGVWAVGQYIKDGLLRTLSLRWNGTSWLKLPSVAGDLWSVSPVAAGDAWAVGNQGEADLAVHWDGAAWTEVPTPYVRDLYGVAAIGTSDAWAVGMGYAGNTVTLHWDGSAWSRVRSPSPGGIRDELLDVSATSSTDVWAVGRFTKSVGTGQVQRTLVLHWNGLAWSRI
jgi:hypothetical protein